jgi:hypothetical protein
MTTSDASWSARFRLIGELERPNHHYLTDQDECFFWGEYTARAGYNHSTTNSIITNLKKKPSTRGTGQWQYKVTEIARVARVMKAAINPAALAGLTFVPIPPSKMVGDAEYDDRMSQIARQISLGGTRELIRAIAPRVARHSGDNKHDPDELRATLQIDEALCTPSPTRIFLIDDVITTGCGFMVCKQMLTERFPDVKVTGMFVARRALPPTASMFDALD